MTMSMYSSYTPEDFNNIEEDIFGKCGKTYRFRIPIYFGVAMPDRLGVLPYLSHNSPNLQISIITIESLLHATKA